MALYLRLNGIVPPSSRPNPPKVQESYWILSQHPGDDMVPLGEIR